MADKKEVPKVSATINITKYEDRSQPMNITIQGLWTHVEIMALERLILKELRGHLVRMRNQPQSKGQDS